MHQNAVTETLNYKNLSWYIVNGILRPSPGLNTPTLPPNLKAWLRLCTVHSSVQAVHIACCTESI